MSIDANLTKGIKIFAGNSNGPLAEKIAKSLGVELSDLDAGKFSDGESTIRINETVRGYDVFVIQSTSAPVNDNLMELLIIIDAMKRASAGRITAIMPYFGYARQDMKYNPRDPISARLVAELLYTAGANRVLSMDIHTTQIQGFFNCPMENMRGKPILIDYYRTKIKSVGGDFVVVSSSTGAVKRNRAVAEALDLPLAIIDRRLYKNDMDNTTSIIGDVNGKNVLMVDDIINTGETICTSAEDLKNNGVDKIFACVSHPILSGNALEMIQASPIEELVMLDTINQEAYRGAKCVKILSVCDVFANAIIAIHNNESVSRLYNKLL